MKIISVKLLKFLEYNLNFLPPIKFEVELEGEQLLYFEDKKLGIDVFAYTFEELLDNFKEDIFFLWENYAKCDDKYLIEKAKN